MAKRQKKAVRDGRSWQVLAGAGLICGIVSLDAAAQSTIRLELLGRYESGLFDQSAAEIPAYDPIHQRLYVVNAATGVDILDLVDPRNPTFFGALIAGSPAGEIPFGGANSVAIHGQSVAVAIEHADKQAPGAVWFYDLNQQFTGSVGVGALPDMLTFTPDGSRLLVANEGEPNSTYTRDPVGSVSIVDMATRTAVTASFENLDPAIVQAPSTPGRPDGVRVFGPGASFAQDVEPEYIAVSQDGRTAYVALQENNALAVIDVASATVKAVHAFGLKDHGQDGNGLDTSDQDGGINIRTRPNLFGTYMPDAISLYEVGGETFIVTANEGDARVYGPDEDNPVFTEEYRVRNLRSENAAINSGLYILNEAGEKVALRLNPDVFAEVNPGDNSDLGRMKLTLYRYDSNNDGVVDDRDSFIGDLDGDGTLDELYAFGARSVSIWKVGEDRLEQVFDSGDQFEQITARQLGDTGFNANHDAQSADGRSDDKGPEPEGVTIAVIDGRTYAFIGLERVGGVMVYDITDPAAATFVEYVNPRDFAAMLDFEQGDLGPEGLLFIDGSLRPDGLSLLVVANEVSGTTSIYGVNLVPVAVPTPAAAGLVLLGLLAIAQRRVRG